MVKIWESEVESVKFHFQIYHNLQTPYYFL